MAEEAAPAQRHGRPLQLSGKQLQLGDETAAFGNPPQQPEAVALAQREVLLLVAVEGLTPAEAAPILDLSPEALRQRLRRARAILQARLSRTQSHE